MPLFGPSRRCSERADQQQAEQATDLARSSGSWLSRLSRSMGSPSEQSAMPKRSARPMPPRGQMQMQMQRPRLSVPMDFSGFNDDDELPRAAAPSAAAAAQPEPPVDAAGSLTVSTRIEYAALPAGKEQDVFGVVTVQAAVQVAEQEEKRQPLDLICVMDISGSMQGQKIQLVKDAMRLIINESQPQDRLSIVTFNNQADRQLRLRRMDAHGKNEATTTTLRMSASGGTRIAAGLEVAVEVAERRRQRNVVSSIFLLTDGQDGSSGELYQPLLQRMQRVGCSLYNFGFGADHDARLLGDLAERAQTPFTYVEDVDNIRAAFVGAMGGLSSVVAQDVSVVLDSRAVLKGVHTPFALTREGNRTIVKIPDMLAGERRDVLVEVTVPAHTGAEEAETAVLQASVQYMDLGTGCLAQVPAVEMLLRRTSEDEPQPELEPDVEVVVQRQRVEVAQTLEDAAAHGDAGRFDEAQKLLKSKADHMKSSSVRSPVSEGLVLELEDAERRMQSRASWEHGGCAELRDAMQMHKMQRCTNVSPSVSAPGVAQKRSKAMYLTSVQQSWVSKASPAP